MEDNSEIVEKTGTSRNGHITVWLLGALVMIGLIVVTLEISHRNISTFISTQQKYIVSIETTILVAFIVEMLTRLDVFNSRFPHMVQHAARLRILIRIAGYSIGSLFVLSILASNPALGISVAAVAGVATAFATQNIIASISATVALTNGLIVKTGEEIKVNHISGKVADINLTHTVLSVADEVVFVPNSVLISSIVRRKKRVSGSDNNVRDW